MKKVLILGGYGNFGKRIAASLAKAAIPIIISGRNCEKATFLANDLSKKFTNSLIETAIIDVKNNFALVLEKLEPYIVINTIGPFQASNYNIARDCIAKSIHYIDLADGRDFVCNISSLDWIAKNSAVIVISGASTVPCLSSAVLEKFKTEFSKIDSLNFGITPGQKTERGLATTRAILSYIGKPIKISRRNGKNNNDNSKIIYGWQDLHQIKYPEIGTRLMANCDIPDLDLLPLHYNIDNVRFFAGMESSLLHLAIWLISWLVRLKIIKNISNYAKILLKLSHYFDFFGSNNGGMHMIIRGKDINGAEKEIKWFVIAKNGDGPQIPAIPAIILTKKIIAKELTKTGAMPCVAMISLDEYFAELTNFDISQYIESSSQEV